MKYLSCLIVIFAAFVAAVACNNKQPRNDAKPVHLEVYYESYCPDSKRFITTQLYPTWELLQDIVYVDLVPYGKAEVSFVS